MARFSANEDEILVEEVQKYPGIFDYEDKNYKNFISKENAWKGIAFSVGRSVDEGKKRWKSINDHYFRIRKKSKLGTGSSASEKPIKWNLRERLLFLDKVKHERESKNTLEEVVASTADVNSENLTSDEHSLEDRDLENFNSPLSPMSLRDEKTKEKSVAGEEHDNLRDDSGSSTPCSIPPLKRSRLKQSREFYLSGFEERAQKRMNLLEELQNKRKTESEDDVDLFMKSISLSVKKLPDNLIDEAKMNILAIVSDLQTRARQMSEKKSNVDPCFGSTSYYVKPSAHGSDFNPDFTISSANPTYIAGNSQPSTSSFPRSMVPDPQGQNKYFKFAFSNITPTYMSNSSQQGSFAVQSMINRQELLNLTPVTQSFQQIAKTPYPPRQNTAFSNVTTAIKSESYSNPITSDNQFSMTNAILPGDNAE